MLRSVSRLGGQKRSEAEFCLLPGVHALFNSLPLRGENTYEYDGCHSHD